jgi:hypothetical protein
MAVTELLPVKSNTEQPADGVMRAASFLERTNPVHIKY